VVDIAQKDPWGASSFDQGDQDAALGISDQAKRVAATRQAALEAQTKQNLQKLGSDHAEAMESLNDRIADHVIKQLREQEVKEIDPDTDPEGHMQELATRIKEMENKAKSVDKSGTGNVGAMNTYLQVADILKKRLHRMQSQDAGIPANTQVNQPASAPAAPPQPVPPTFPMGGTIRRPF
jgi:hypothetical protein